MTEQQIQAAIVEALAEEVLRRVCEKLTALQKKALVVCTGSGLAFPVWLSGLQQLQQSGFHFDLFLSRSAERVLDVSALRQGVRFGQVWQDNGEHIPELLAADYPTIIVPAMTINTAAKIAACTADTPASRIIFTSMMRGKNVVISVDGCCPDNEDRAAKGYIFTEPLKEQLRANMMRLKDFGARLATSGTLAARTMKVIGGVIPQTPSTAPPGTPPEHHVSKRKIIGRQDIAALPAGGTLRIPRGSQITQLAADVAHTRGITLIEE